MFLLLQFPSAAAQNQQGFSWGVLEGARFDFHYRQHIPDLDQGPENIVYYETEFDFYFIVNNLPEIPDDLTQNHIEWQDDDLSYYFLNGTHISVCCKNGCKS